MAIFSVVTSRGCRTGKRPENSDERCVRALPVDEAAFHHAKDTAHLGENPLGVLFSRLRRHEFEEERDVVRKLRGAAVHAACSVALAKVLHRLTPVTVRAVDEVKEIEALGGV